MKVFKYAISIFALFVLTMNIAPSFAFCGDETPDDGDKQCSSTQCGGSDEEIKGCVPAGDCPEGYSEKEAGVCCCKD